MITIHVLGFGEIFQGFLNGLAAFMKQDSFSGFLRLTALVGIIMASVGYLKRRDPMDFGKWVIGYVLVINLVILPKTDVDIYDIAAQKSRVVSNVPVVFAVAASLITGVGVELAQEYDSLLSMPDDLTYTKTGSLFGSKIIQASHDFHIIDLQLKHEMDSYLRNCVVGDIRLNHKYSMGDLGASDNIWSLISAKASPLRMTKVNGKNVTCLVASAGKGQYSLRVKLDAEIKKAYKFFGINLFGRQSKNVYKKLFETHLRSAADYYQNMTDSAADIFLQSMMINAIGDGIKNYQAFTDSTAGVVNNQVAKSKVQHRWSWEIAGQKAAWFLPLLHTLLTIMLFGIFPIIMVMTTLPNGIGIFKGYLQFFVSLQFWPVLFAILNAVMTWYGQSQAQKYGLFTMINIDKIDELHADLSGVAGYLMLMIPFIAKGLVSNLSEAFSGLATSMTGHLQGSAMAVANDAASASFGLGQTSFYNTSANNMNANNTSANNVSENNTSANKHDTNWTNFHGMHSNQMETGVVKTTTGSGESNYDVSPAMTKSAVSITDAKAMSASLNQAYEQSDQAAKNESAHYQSALSNFAHRAIQLSQLAGHDMRLGDGVSSSENGQYSKALSTMNHIAEDVANRIGISKEDAFAHLTSAGWGSNVGIKTDKSLIGGLMRRGIGVSGGGDAHMKYDKSSTSSDRYNTGSDSSVSARQSKDFNDALNYVTHFAQTHNFDESHSTAASLSNQMGADLRDAQTASQNYEANLSRSQRISKAKSFVESDTGQITENLDQAFHAYVSKKLNGASQDELYGHPGSMESLNKLKSLGQDFISNKREELIANYGNQGREEQIESFYKQEKDQLITKGNQLGGIYQKNNDQLVTGAKELDVGIDNNQAQQLKQDVSEKITTFKTQSDEGYGLIRGSREALINETDKEINNGKVKAQKNTILREDWLRNEGLHHKDEE